MERLRVQKGVSMNKVTKACSISAQTRREVIDRDKVCIFCKRQGHQIMHFISRGSLGLGIKENLAFGCINCHRMLDQSEYRTVMLIEFREHLDKFYPEFPDEKRRYRK